MSMRRQYLMFVFLCTAMLCILGAGKSFAQHPTVDVAVPVYKSIFLEQAYDHYKVKSSASHSVSRRGVELYLKNDLINQAYDFLGKRNEDVDVGEIDAVIVDLQDTRNFVHFLGRDVTGGLKGVFGVEIIGKRMTYVHFPKVPEYIEEMYNIYVLAHKSVKGPCQLDYNMIVLHEDGQYLVYNVVAEPHDKSVIVGGHFLLKMARDKKTGKLKINEYKPFDTLCVPVNKSLIDKDGRIALNYAAFPSEIHSFLSLQYELPILINTGTDKWEVSKGLIKRIH
ncbi:MAG: hypothetical protein NZ828_02185 [Alphaproteobacteria bacterium]|nr:hypothetical protein [Alphaproteobacteria bacterium]